MMNTERGTYMKDCKSIEDIRECIDTLDYEIVKLIAQRSQYVKQAAQFKKDSNDVKAPRRVEAIIEKVRGIAMDNEFIESR